MKLSYYNIMTDIPNGKVLYNSLYKNISELSADYVQIFENLVNNGLIPSDDKETEVLEYLKEQMFVVEDEMDELEYFKLGWNRSLYSFGIIRHTVLPNLACNFDCPYCFECKTGKFMSEQTELDYLAWLEPQLVDAKHFYLTWYGGEPLLSKGTIKRITDAILVMKEKYGFEYSASLVTNGYLLDDEFIKQIDQLCIKCVQVTFDGDEEIHNKYRFLNITKNGTFSTILSNMKNYCENTVSDVAAILRVNVTDENYDSIPALLEKIPNSIKKRCILLIRWIYGHSDGRSPGKEFSEKLKGESPYTNLYPLYQLAEEMGFTTNSFDEGVSYNFCECDFDKAFIIDQDGDIFMCSHSMKKEETVGNVREGFTSQKDFSRYAKFVNTNPFEDKECIACKILPICKGGCRKARFIGRRACSGVKYDVSGYVLQKYHKAQAALAAE